VADGLSGDGTGGRAFRSTATVVGGGITGFHFNNLKDYWSS